LLPQIRDHRLLRACERDRQRRFTARQSNAATDRINRDVRMFEALATEMPTPLKNAT
jgi:hypothetical protein